MISMSNSVWKLEPSVKTNKMNFKCTIEKTHASTVGAGEGLEPPVD
jgi:hypothetical protein